MPKLGHRTLTARLRELENLNLATRKVYPTIPPRVEYELTALGKMLHEALSELDQLGADCCLHPGQSRKPGNVSGVSDFDCFCGEFDCSHGGDETGISPGS